MTHFVAELDSQHSHLGVWPDTYPGPHLGHDPRLRVLPGPSKAAALAERTRKLDTPAHSGSQRGGSGRPATAPVDGGIPPL